MSVLNYLQSLSRFLWLVVVCTRILGFAFETMKVSANEDEMLWYNNGHDDPVTSPVYFALENYTQQMSVSVPFDVICSIIAKRNDAILHQFTDGNCSVYGMGMDSMSSKFFIWTLPQAIALEDVSRGKKVYSSSDYSPSTAKDKVVDDDDLSIFSSHTETNPWWMLDIGEMRILYEIHIMPRTDFGPGRFHDVEIRLGTELITNGNFSSYMLLHYYKGPYTLAEGRFFLTLKKEWKIPQPLYQRCCTGHAA